MPKVEKLLGKGRELSQGLGIVQVTRMSLDEEWLTPWVVWGEIQDGPGKGCEWRLS